jgi:uncharacterized protein
MINVTIKRDVKNSICKFEVEGHAWYSDNGSDIVCAAVSAVAYTAVGALEDLVGVKGHIERDGYMSLNVPIDIDEKLRRVADIILESMLIGFKQIELSYRKYVKVIEC